MPSAEVQFFQITAFRLHRMVSGDMQNLLARSIQKSSSMNLPVLKTVSVSVRGACPNYPVKQLIIDGKFFGLTDKQIEVSDCMRITKISELN